MTQHKITLTRKEKTLEKIRNRLKKIFKHDDFYDANKHKIIVSPMPDLKKYLDKSRKARLSLNASTPDFLRPCYSEALLSAEQERHLFRRYNFHKFRASQHLENGKIKLALTELRSADCCKKLIISANLRLVISLVKKLKHSESNYEDIVSEGYFLICRIIDCFDWTRGFKFSTYASNSIFNTIGRTCSQMIKHDLTQQTVEENIEVLTTDTQQELLQKQEHHKKLVRKLLGFCSPREKQILSLRFIKGQTLLTIADSLGISKERVRQIETNGIKKIVSQARQVGLTPDFIWA